MQKMNYGINGCAIALNITYSLCIVCVLIYIKFQNNEDVNKSWHTFIHTKVSLNGMGFFWRLSMSCLMMTFFEMASVEAIEVLGGNLGVAE